MKLFSCYCATLISAGLLVLAEQSLARDFHWPVACEPGTNGCLSNIGYPDIDGDGFAFNCGAPGYAFHLGTDINVNPESVAGGVDVVASTNGIVEWVFDGKNDKCPSSHPDCQAPPSGWAEPGQSNGYRVCTDANYPCPGGGGGCFRCFDGGNVVVIDHPESENNPATLYYHLKKNSILVGEGDTVFAGEKIAEIASSGDSVWPHLHFEIRTNSLLDVMDPWAGSCGPTTQDTYWKYDEPWVATPTSLVGETWRQISLPAAPPGGENTVAALFADDISGSYGTSWILYGFDAVQNGYVQLSTSSMLSVATGYWMTHTNAASHLLDMPAATSGTPMSVDSRCASSSGRCARSDLVASQPHVQWHMVGNPFSQSISLADIRVATDSGDCANGCTLNQANAANLVSDELYALVNGPGYDVFAMGDELPAWQGAWIATLSGAASTTISMLWSR